MKAQILMVGTLIASTALAQPKPAAQDPKNPFSSVIKTSWDRTKKLLIAAADEMPVATYAYQPTPDVRTFGQLIGHVADSNRMFCALASKDTKKPGKNDSEDSAEKLTTKADLQKALADAIAYCDKVYAGINDKDLGSIQVQMFGQTMPMFAPLNVNLAHDMEHYGNIVTYLRMNKLVPPSSQHDK
jgi:uncharacterized damage-inducible protein DinB